jgi:hypothetical protein
MSDTHVRFEDGRFSYRGSNPPWSPSALGKDIVLTLMRGVQWTDFGLSPDDAVEALRLTGRTGKLCFSVQDDQPVFPWFAQEAARLRARAEQLEVMAAELRDSGANEPCDVLNGRVCDTLKLSAAKLWVHAGALYGLARNPGPLARRYQLPAVKVGAKGAGDSGVFWNQGSRCWQFGNYRLGPAKLGRLIALTLLSGREMVTLNGSYFTVNYLVDMVRRTGSEGRFREDFDEGFNFFSPVRNLGWGIR